MKLTTVSNDLVTIDKTYDEGLNESGCIGIIVCPFCSKKINVAYSYAKLSNGRPGKPWWNTSNFDSHLKMHQFHYEEEENEDPSE